MITTELPERIEEKIEREPTSGCWLWTGARTARLSARISMSTIALAVGLVLLFSGAAWAQTTPPEVNSTCSQSLPCLRQAMQDLRDYRQFLEDSLALAKSLLNQANLRIAEQAKELQALKEAGAAPEKKNP